jgi:ribosome-associated translation inhibitor RaiA
MTDEAMLDNAEVVVHTGGRVPEDARVYAHDKIAHVLKFASGRVLFAKVDLVAHADPARERSAFAKAELDVNGRMVRAHAAATTMFEAVDLLEGRLRERIERLAHAQEAKHFRHRGDDHEWHRGDLPASRRPYFPRPVDEREIVRHKTFAAGDATPEEAVLELEQLDHDFYLFHNVVTDEDNVLWRLAAGQYQLLEPSPAATPTEPGSGISPSPIRPSGMNLEGAIELLGLGDQPFVFFLDQDTTGRGSVVYRRYDGHYGLIETARDSD